MTSRISESGTAPMRPAQGPRAGRRASAPSGAGARGDAGRLGRDDWLDAAHDAVVAGGFDAVRVLSLADALGISRGSFYWHFDSHAELVAALIARWLEREAEADHALAARMSDDPVADLRRLLDAALARGGRDLKAMRFELALRELGRQDPEVAQRVLEVDARRMSVLGAHFERLTGNAREARELAALMYVAVAGAHQALAYASVAAGASGYLRDVIAKYLIGERVTAPAAGVAPVPAPDTAPSPTPARRARRGGVS